MMTRKKLIFRSLPTLLQRSNGIRAVSVTISKCLENFQFRGIGSEVSNVGSNPRFPNDYLHEEMIRPAVADVEGF